MIDGITDNTPKRHTLKLEEISAITSASIFVFLFGFVMTAATLISTVGFVSVVFDDAITAKQSVLGVVILIGLFYITFKSWKTFEKINRLSNTIGN